MDDSELETVKGGEKVIATQFKGYESWGSKADYEDWRLLECNDVYQAARRYELRGTN
jgi:hypothetical protein